MSQILYRLSIFTTLNSIKIKIIETELLVLISRASIYLYGMARPARRGQDFSTIPSIPPYFPSLHLNQSEMRLNQHEPYRPGV